MRRSGGFLVVLALSCGPIPAPGPVSITVEPVSASVEAGGQKTFTAKVVGSKDTSVTWSVKESGGGSVDTAGHYTAPKVAGTYHLVATANADPTQSASAQVTVSAVTQVAIAIAPTTVELGFESTQQFTATVTGSSNTSAHFTVMEGASGGSISPSGLYTAPLGSGTFHVVATADADGAQNAVATVTVHSALVLSPAAAMLNPLQTQMFTVAGGEPVTWAVAEGATGGSIDQDGVYTASPAVGVYHVVATSLANASVTGTAEITVTLNPQLGVTISPSSATVDQGGLLQLTATVSYATDTTVKWSVQEGALGGSITAAGAYTAPGSPGTFHVIATSNEDPTRSTVATITVAPVAVSLSPSTVTLPSGGTQDFVATVTGTSDPGLSWSASAGTVDANGHFTAPAHPNGQITVTAASTFDPSKKAVAHVTVTPVAVAITAQPAGAVDQGSTFTFAAQVTGGADGAFTWSADCGTFAGDVWTAPNAAGVCNVTATSVLDASAQKKVPVTVRDVAIAITAQPSGNVDQGSTFTFAAVVTGSVNTQFAWSADCGSFAGDVWTAPSSAGQCHLSATAAADPLKTVPATVTVNDVAISITAQPSGAVDQGSTFTFAAQVTGTVNTGVTFTAPCGNFIGAQWTAPNVAGVCVITAIANANAGRTQPASVTVKPVTVTITSQPPGTVDQGSTFTFTSSASGSVDTGVVFGASCGTFTGSTWTAPASAGPCTITATSHGDSTSHTSVPVQVAPVTVNLTASTAGPLDQGAQFPFAASVTGAVDTTVSWSASCGTMTGATFTAPNAGGTCTVTATSNWNGTTHAQRDVAINGVTISLNPGVAQVAPNTTHGFVATVSGTTNKAVSWSLDSGGGTLGPNGMYLAPASLGTAVVRATSVADPARSATATVTISSTVAVTVSPGTLTLGVGQQQSFAATVTGAANTGVRWSVQGGAVNGVISAAGLYTAPSTPGTYTVIATALEDGLAQGSSTVTVGAAPQLVVSMAPSSVQLAPRGTQVFTATVSGSANQTVNWVVHEGPAGGTIDGAGVYTAPPVSGLYHVVAMSQADPSREAFATVTVSTGAPVSVSVSPAFVVMAPGASQTFSATVKGTSNPGVTWSSSCGTIDASGHFTAAATSCVISAASVVDATKTGVATVIASATASVSAQPAQITVAYGDSYAASAVVTGALDTSVDWSIENDPGNTGVVDALTGVYSSASATAARPFTVALRAVSNANGAAAALVNVTVVDSTLRTVSGVVTYGGTRGPGRVFIAVNDSSGAVVGGTSLAGPGAYTVRCLGGAGAFTAKAWMDLDGYARPDLAIFPAGTASFVFVGADVTGANIAIADPLVMVPGATTVQVQPFDRGLSVMFQRLVDVDGADLADHYDVFVSDSPDPGPANNLFFRQVGATSSPLALATGLTNGTGYYASVRAVSVAGAGPLTTVGPIAAGSAAGTFTVTGQVLYTLRVPLLVGVQSGDSGPLWATTLSGPGPFSISGVPAGTYRLFAIADLGGDGVLSPLDPTVETPVTVSGDLNAGDLSFASGHATLSVGTEHDFDVLAGPLTERWYLNLELDPVDRIPVRAVVLGGPQALDLPVDLGVRWNQGGALEGRDFYSVPSSPAVGDSYRVAVWFADGTAEVLSSAVNAVLTPPGSLVPSGAGAGLTPVLSWAAPVPAPATAYSYEVFVVELPGITPIWSADRLSALSLPYAGPALNGAGVYGFSVRVRDAAGNAAAANASFSP
ncbi:MAG: hypothetical protein QM723_15950 [Myxococcaceae bacterium]